LVSAKKDLEGKEAEEVNWASPQQSKYPKKTLNREKEKGESDGEEGVLGGEWVFQASFLHS